MKSPREKTLTAPMAAETPVVLDAAADISAADHGLARASGYSDCRFAYDLYSTKEASSNSSLGLRGNSLLRSP